MSKKIDWYYHRKGSTSCVRAQEFLANREIVATEAVDARAKLGRADALQMAKAASKLIVANGKNVVTFSMHKDSPDDRTLAAHMLGPTGTLRAPTIRKGETLLVEFNEEVFIQALRV